ncbi:glycoside hydrolase family protein [Deminuibacter soli]|uniref:Uncharacterized protein n=1 Tax=Deminuibacter soli TaxID=2291815 RepID=A0A3E1NFP0_9BACT|nr:lanthionine synthetase LanC family protein [Deminuibacter soli]RFM26692.1 hypothetical protein DXN05_19180 [Deminuibacter soli]
MLSILSGLLLTETLLPAQKNAEPAGLGLLNGRAGMLPVYYLLHKQTGNAQYKMTGEQLLECIGEHISSVQNNTFGDGLAGIGWTIEWLVQHKLLEGVNTDEVLEDVDDFLYREVIYGNESDISLCNGTMGKLAYFLRREWSKNPGTNRFKHICHQECIVLLTDALADWLDDLNLSAARESQLRDIADLLVGITSVTDINQLTVEAILYKAASYTEQLLNAAIHRLQTEPDTENAYVYQAMRLGVCYLIAGKKHQLQHWQLQAMQYVHKLQALLPGDETDDELLFQRLTIYSLLHAYIPEPGNSDHLLQLIQALAARKQPCRLKNGAGAVVMAALVLQDASLAQNWHELFF